MPFLKFDEDDFKRKKAEGDIYETEALKRALQLANQNEPPHRHFKVGIVQTDFNFRTFHYDYQLVSKRSETQMEEITFEVKLDKRSNDTDNFFVEFRDDWGGPSGIEITTATHHILAVGTTYYLIETEVLRANIKMLPQQRRILTKRGPKGSRGYILPRAVINELSEKTL